MCLIGFALDCHAGSLLLASNRDEYLDRPTSTAHWWYEKPDVFGGRDQQAGGTWLGLNKNGRLAALTNYRDGGGATARSRGELVTMALNTESAVQTVVEQIASSINQYAGCSLLIFDWMSQSSGGTMMGWCLSNRDNSVTRQLESGVFALSNGLFDEPWPKSERIKRTIESVMAQPHHLADQALLSTLTDHQIPDVGALPDTGIGEQREAELAPAFIRTSALGNSYGTRSSAILRVDAGVQTRFDEWTWEHGDAPQLQSHRQMQYCSN